MFVAADDIATEQTIRIGRQNVQFAEVLEGLEAGTTVVMHPNDALVTGAEIIARSSLQ